MKRIAALVMALIMLLGCAATIAESSGTLLSASKLRASLIGSDNKNVARLHGMGLDVAVGSAEGVPTLQVSLYYGDGQQLDSVVQLVENRVVLCVGGISGTFYADLNAFLDEEQCNMLTTAVGTGLMMFGANPQLVLQMIMPANSNGVNRKTIKIPADQYQAYVEPLAKTLRETGAFTEEDLKVLVDGADQSDEPVELRLRYNPKTEKLMIKIIRDGKGLYFRCNVAITTGPMEFINISNDEIQYDLLNLDEEVMDELDSEVDFLGLKLDSFVENSNIRKLTGDGAQ